MEQKSCKERIKERWSEDFKEIKRLWQDYLKGGEEIYDYGLSFDYIESGTYEGQKIPYYCWQLSWGGPASEIRFFTGSDDIPYKIQYWFLDWFDGDHINLKGEEFQLLAEIFNNFLNLK